MQVHWLLVSMDNLQKVLEFKEELDKGTHWNLARPYHFVIVGKTHNQLHKQETPLNIMFSVM